MIEKKQMLKLVEEIDTTSIKSKEELIEIGKKLSTDEERVALLGKYFIENVMYNYDVVEALGQGTNYSYYKLKELQEKYNCRSEEDRKKCLEELKTYMKERMLERYHSDDKTLLDKVLDVRMARITSLYGQIISATPEEKRGFVRIHATPQRCIDLIRHITDDEKNWESIEDEQMWKGTTSRVGGGYALGVPEIKKEEIDEQSGLLTAGVCGQFAAWAKQIFDSWGIPCEIVDGKGTVGHAWNLIKINGKIGHFDPTMMDFYQRQYGSNPENAEPQDWIFASTEDAFTMQPTREIHGIGKRNLNYEQYITEKNYSSKQAQEFIEDTFENVQEQTQGEKTEEILKKVKDLTQEERKRGNQYLSALENEQNRTK